MEEDDGTSLSDGRSVLEELQRGRVVIIHQLSFYLNRLHSVIIHVVYHEHD